jgi:hypothetical protein
MTEPHSTSDEPAGEADWIVDEHGQARRPHGKPQGEPKSYEESELDGGLLSQIDRDRREREKLVEYLTDGTQVRKRLGF